MQAHSASLGMTFYDGGQFPAEYRGSIFAAEHGLWNRSKRTGYKIIRAIVKDGVPIGEYEDFVTGFVISDAEVWGRPVGVTVDKDGAPLISEDASGTIWRITYAEKPRRRSETSRASAGRRVEPNGGELPPARPPAGNFRPAGSRPEQPMPQGVSDHSRVAFRDGSIRSRRSFASCVQLPH